MPSTSFSHHHQLTYSPIQSTLLSYEAHDRITNLVFLLTNLSLPFLFLQTSSENTIKMHSATVAATFFTLFSASSAMYFPRAASNGTQNAGPSASGGGAPSPSGSGGAGAAGGDTYTASFTQYGGGDARGSKNCNDASAACGFFNNPGYNAAVSEALFGKGDGQGAGPACGTCWKLTPKTDETGKPMTGTKEVVVKVNNLCPADSNELCAQKTLQDKNKHGANVNFDLCADDHANDLFGSSGQQLAIGTATKVDCSLWTGSQNLLHM